MPEHERKLRDATRTYARARRRRDAAMCEAHTAGMTYRAIAAIVGLSHQRVAQIVAAHGWTLFGQATSTSRSAIDQ